MRKIYGENFNESCAYHQSFAQVTRFCCEETFEILPTIDDFYVVVELNLKSLDEISKFLLSPLTESSVPCTQPFFFSLT